MMAPEANLDNVFFWRPPSTTAATTSTGVTRERQQRSTDTESSVEDAGVCALQREMDDSLLDQSVLATIVRASNEPIWIPSDADSDAEHDGDEARGFDDSRSDATLPSINTLATRSRSSTAVHAGKP